METATALIEATKARERMDYPSAIALYTKVVNHRDASVWERCQAYHMRGVCQRCVGSGLMTVQDAEAAMTCFEKALADFCEARQSANYDPVIIARIARDEAMVYIDREAEGDAEEATSLIRSSLHSLEETARWASSHGQRRQLMGEYKCSIGFRGRLALKRGDVGTAIADLREAMRGLLRNGWFHYAVNNQVWLCRALSQYQQRSVMQHAHMRGHALIGMLLCFIPRAGSVKRFGEFVALFIGGEPAHQRALRLMHRLSEAKRRLMARLARK